MRFKQLSSAIAACLISVSPTIAQSKSVFAHFMVGNVQSFQQADWERDIDAAKASGIDGFALNIGAENIDATAFTQPQLDNAYNAASGKDFKMFISFDYAANPGFTIDIVSGLINTYKAKDAQFFYTDGRPLASTFEGGERSADWNTIKSNTGCFFIPDWTSRKFDANVFAPADGGLSWDVWPVGANDMTSAVDADWQSFLGDKAYMMGISPWFYTNLPDLDKTFTWRGNKLWHKRWEAARTLQPELVEIITWNDFGESHYVGPLNPAEYYPGSEKYVANVPHDAWRLLLPAYIDAYKGNSGITYDEVLVYAHKPNPGANTDRCSAGDVVGYDYRYQAAVSAAEVSTDAIDVYVLVNSPADVTVKIGDGQAVPLRAETAGVNYFSVPFDGQTGQVTYAVSRDGNDFISFQGQTISPDCVDGQINFNAIVGSSKDITASRAARKWRA